jgi:deoxyribose-phosphate aldolase
MNAVQLARAIDQTSLDPALPLEKFRTFCEEAARYGFASVAILPLHVETAVAMLKGTDVMVGAAIAFPLGAVPASLKAVETADAIRRGAHEVDYVMNVPALKSGEYRLLVDEARQVVAAADRRTVKVIIEMWGLTGDEIRAACEIGCEGGVDFVKSSTGYKGHPRMRPSTLDDARLLLRYTAGRAKVKMAGGITATQTAVDMLEMGVSRLGTSAGVAIVDGLREIQQG